MKLEDLKIACRETDWTVTCTPEEREAEKLHLRIRGERRGEGFLPECTVSFSIPHTGILYRWTPETNFSRFSVRDTSCSATVLYWMMGPAISWGNKVT